MEWNLNEPEELARLPHVTARNRYGEQVFPMVKWHMNDREALLIVTEPQPGFDRSDHHGSCLTVRGLRTGIYYTRGINLDDLTIIEGTGSWIG